MKFAHLKLKKISLPYKYVLLDNLNAFKLLASQVDSKTPIALFASPTEFSAIIPEDIQIPALKTEKDWACIGIVGDMPFGTVQGLIASISTTLIAESIGICVVSTFKTDWFFIKNENFANAVQALTNGGWNIEI
jgi:hypothetical protein